MEPQAIEAHAKQATLLVRLIEQEVQGERTVRATGDAVYVANQGANTLSVIDPSTFKATATIATGNSPYGIAVVRRGPTNE